MNLSDLREDYGKSGGKSGLLESDAAADPIAQFTKWFEDARQSGLLEPNAMTLATVSPDGRPSARIVLLKEVRDGHFIFFTNYLSRKGMELDATRRAALVFFWAELERQVRVEGSVSRVSRAESDTYFRTRPKGSRLGAWASKQSQVVTGREQLERELSALEARYAGTDDVPLPDFWGGYSVQPDVIEFWQGRPNRLHDRLRYRQEGGVWIRERLSP